MEFLAHTECSVKYSLEVGLHYIPFSISATGTKFTCWFDDVF